MGRGIWEVMEMNTTATDAAMEELETRVEIEEAGYTVVMVKHRQTYIQRDSDSSVLRRPARSGAAV